MLPVVMMACWGLSEGLIHSVGFCYNLPTQRFKYRRLKSDHDIGRAEGIVRTARLDASQVEA